MGGDKPLDEHITLPSILQKFNPNLFGYSTGTGSANVWKVRGVAANNPKHRLISDVETVPGAASIDIIGQANDLVRRLKDHPEIDVKNQWKLVHIFIGANDICDWCDYPDMVSSDHLRNNIEKAVNILKDNLPKTIVVLVGMLDLSLLRKIDKGKYFCDALHTSGQSNENNRGWSVYHSKWNNELRSQVINQLNKSILPALEGLGC